GCAGGTIEYEIRRNGVVIQDFSPKPFVLDGPDATARYSARLRCSAGHACTSLVGATRNIGVVTGDGGDVALGAWGSPFNPGTGVLYDRAAATTTLQWWTPDARPADVYRGRLGPGITRGSYVAPFWRLDTSGAIGSAASCLANNVAGSPETPPPAGAGGCGRHAVCAGGSNPAHLCLVDADCPGSFCSQPFSTLSTPGSICLNQSGPVTPPPPAGALDTECPPPGSPTRVVTQVPA